MTREYGGKVAKTAKYEKFGVFQSIINSGAQIAFIGSISILIYGVLLEQEIVDNTIFHIFLPHLFLIAGVSIIASGGLYLSVKWIFYERLRRLEKKLGKRGQQTRGILMYLSYSLLILGLFLMGVALMLLIIKKELLCWFILLLASAFSLAILGYSTKG